MFIRPTKKEILRNAPDNPGGTPPVETPPVETPPAPDFGAFIPEAYKGDDGTYDTAKFREDFDGHAARAGQLEEELTELRGAIPENATGYEIVAPDEIDFGEIEVPDWFAFELDSESPVIAEAQNWLHENNVRPEAVPGLISMFARMKAAEAADHQAMAKEQRDALGANAESRIATIKRALETKLPDAAQRDALMKVAVSADAVRGLESLLKSGSQTPVTTADQNADLMDLPPAERLVEINRRLAEK
jgi:hypothetical protein